MHHHSNNMPLEIPTSNLLLPGLMRDPRIPVLIARDESFAVTKLTPAPDVLRQE